MVSSNFSGGNLAHIDPTVAAYLAGSGVRRVIVGHKPFADSPGIIRTDVASGGNAKPNGQKGSIEVICADSSFSDMSAFDNRGLAGCEVLVHRRGLRDQTEVHGVLRSGKPISFRLPVQVSSSEEIDNHVLNSGQGTGDFPRGDPYVGLAVVGRRGGRWNGSWWVKTPLAGPPMSRAGTAFASYQMVQGRGFELEKRKVTVDAGADPRLAIYD